MAAGRHGPTGQCVARLVGVVHNPELVVVIVQHLPMVGRLVPSRMRKIVHVMISPVEVKQNLLSLISSRHSND